MRSFISDLAYVGDYITPYELDAELAELVEAFHGLDQDNVDDGTLTYDKVNLDAWNVFEYATRTTTRQTTHGESEAKGSIRTVPDEAGTGAFSLSITTADGMLDVGASLTWFKSAPAGSSADFAIGIRVDGTIVAWAPMDLAQQRACPLVDGACFVGAGTHLVEVVFQTHFDGTAAVTVTTDWLPGILWARGLAR